MNYTDKTKARGQNGRSVAGLLESLKGEILAGDFPSGTFMPTVRELSELHEVAPGTAWRALKALEADGLLEARPRHGYRILYEPPSPEKGCPVACLASVERGEDRVFGISHLLQNAVQRAAGKHGWATLNMDLMTRDKRAVIEELKRVRAWGAIVDSYDSRFVKLATEAGLVVIMVDAWHPDMLVDSVIQDGFRGGFLAGQYLGEKGHKRVAWCGSVVSGVHSFTRYGGAVTALRNYGIAVPEAFTIEVRDSDVRAHARKLLSGSNPPTGILALWRGTALEVAQEAHAMGLKLGEDVEIVGWCVEEQYEQGFLPRLPSGYVPPTITWSAESMARIATTRLVERFANPGADPVRISIETKIRAI